MRDCPAECGTVGKYECSSLSLSQLKIVTLISLCYVTTNVADKAIHVNDAVSRTSSVSCHSIVYTSMKYFYQHDFSL